MVLEQEIPTVSVMHSMSDKGGFKFLEHTADAYIAAHGKDLEEAFENSALAMFEVMTEVEKIDRKIEDHVKVEAQDEYSLLYNWLETLLIKFETQGIVYSKFKIMPLAKTSKGYRLEARVWGEKYSPKKHVQKVGVKAATYHRMEIIKNPKGVTAKFILDI